MKKKKLLLAAVSLTLLLGGCAFGNQAVDTTTIIVDKNGTVVEAIVEDFDKDYYDEHGAVDVGDLSQQVEKCNTDIETLKKSVSDGKDLLADAITEKGIQTASDDTFKLMAEKIKQIQSVGYGMYGKADTTIASNGTVRYIYGTCTIEKEGE